MSKRFGIHPDVFTMAGRRSFITAGTFAIGGLTLPGIVRGETPADGNTTGKSIRQIIPSPGSSATADSGKPEITATFSIVAVDPQSRVCGAAVASKYPAVGRVVPYVRADVGAFCTQHYHVPKWGEPALDMLQQGQSPAAVIHELLHDDKDAEQRQLAMVDMRGRTAVHNPTNAGINSHYWVR